MIRFSDLYYTHLNCRSLINVVDIQTTSTFLVIALYTTPRIERSNFNFEVYVTIRTVSETLPGFLAELLYLSVGNLVFQSKI